MVTRFSFGNSRFAGISLLLFMLTIAINGQIHTKTVPAVAMGYHIPGRIQADIALGYNNALALLEWFGLIDDFGGRKGDHDFTDIAERLDTITRLNPRAGHAYYMAATVLPWGMHSTALSRPLLERAMRSMPKNWRWPYYAGFNAYWFNHDSGDAARLMSQAARLPGAPPIIANLAARMRAQGGDLDTALAFLHSLLHNEQDASFVKELKSQIIQIETEKVLRRVDRMLARIPGWRKKKRNLGSLGIALPKVLPDGGHIVINAEGIPVSSVTGKRYRVFAPPHRQGKKQ